MFLYVSGITSWSGTSDVSGGHYRALAVSIFQSTFDLLGKRLPYLYMLTYFEARRCSALKPRTRWATWLT